MATSQLDFLSDEKRSIGALVSSFGGLVLSQSWAEPYSTSNVHIIEDGVRSLIIEVTHKNSQSFYLAVVRDSVRKFAAGDIGLCQLTC